MMALRVALVEPDFLVLAALTQLVGGAADLELSSVCSSREGLRDALADGIPDVVVTDLRLPPGMADEGIQIGRELRATHPGVGVMVLTACDDPLFLVELVRSGTHGRGYVLRARVRSDQQLISAIAAVARGGSVVDPILVQALVRSRPTGDRHLDGLSAREHDVLVEMATGASNAAIAVRAGMSKREVERHVGSIFSKLGLTATPYVSRRVQAVLRFVGEAGSGPARAP
jgi:DNA-binding NarL/FixJ family response regulator